jgi:hypothetical protein
MKSMLNATLPLRCCFWLLPAVVAGYHPVSADDDGPLGKRIYGTQCAICHGQQGEGSDEYDRELTGDLSIAQLADVIGETMPLDDPGSLSAEQSLAVATYVHDAFYSPIARQRSRPARIELARLTVTQHRRALTDLIASFRGPTNWGDERGLQAEYYRGRQPGSSRNRAISRIDPRVDFDFGTKAPSSEITDPLRFSIRWDGAIHAPETGFYEFVVRTENATRLWINDMDNMLLDAWVKSGDDTEYAARLFLLGGTAYPLRLEFTKANQGVDDSDKDLPPATASITLLWRRPSGALQPIPNRYFSPESTPESYVCSTPFPPDDRSYGWERGVSVSKAWEQATTSAAIDMAGYVAARVNRLAGTDDGDEEREKKIRSFCEVFAERAFRKPLSPEQKELYVTRHFRDVSLDDAVKRVVLLVLKSPRFLFREVGDGPDAYDVAARLSFGLWNSIPDRELMQAAAENRLATRDQALQQAERMLSDLRAKAKLRTFLLTWLDLDHPHDLDKDPEAFPGFDEHVIADLRASLELTLEDILWSEGADFRRLLLDNAVFLNDRLAKFYASEVTADESFTKIELDDALRAGVLTHPYLMANLADRRQSSPIHRGVLLARGILGVSLRPPPVAVAPIAADLHPNLSTRERVTLQTKPKDCMTCHGIINPLGFTLERFDAIGGIRESDRGKPIDDSGSYRTREGQVIEINGPRALAEMFVNSEEVHTSFVEQLYHHLVQQPVRAYGPETLSKLRQAFVEHDMNIRKLAVEVMATSALVGRDPVTGP